MHLRLLSLLSALALSACTTTTASRAGAPSRAAPTFAADQDTGAGTPVARTPGARANTDVVCYYERPTGSNIPEKVCRPKTSAERERDQAQDMMRTLPSVNMRPGS